MYAENQAMDVSLNQQIGRAPGLSGLAAGRAITQGTRATEKPEQLSDVSGETMKYLGNAIQQLDYLIDKTIGSQPQGSEACVEAPPRSLANDARMIRGMSAAICDRVQRLHDFIGHN